MRIRYAGLGLLALSLSAISSAQPPMLDRVPADTLLYVGWAGRSLVFDGSAMGQMLQDPSVGRMFQAIGMVTQGQLTDNQAEAFPHARAMASMAWQHPAALAITDVRGAEGHGFSGLLLVDLDGDRERFEGELTSLIQKLPDGLTVGKHSLEGTDFWTISGGNGLPAQAALGFKEDVFFLATDVVSAERFIRLKEESSLQATTKFKECWSKVDGQRGQLGIYMDISRLLSRLDAVASRPPSEAGTEGQLVPASRKAGQALGLGKCTALAYSARIVGRGIHAKGRLFTPAPHRGLLRALSGAPLGENDLSVIPGDADFFLAMRVSPEVIWAEVRRSLQLLSPTTDEKLAREIQQFEKKAGVSIAGDVLANLGDSMVLSGTPSQGGFMTGTVLSFPVKDAEKLSAAIARIEGYIEDEFGQDSDAGGPSLRKYATGRTEISYLTGRGRTFLPIAPAWAIHEGRLYIAGWPQVIASAIGKDSAATSISANPCYRKVRSRLSAPAAVTSYVNTPQVVRQLYGSILPGLTLASGLLSTHSGVSPDIGWLPALPTIEKYLWADVTTVLADRDGVTVETYGSLPAMGPSLAPICLAMVSASAALPRLTDAKEAQVVISQSNLKAIYGASMLYAEDHEGVLPPNLTDLYGHYIEAPGVFVSPASRRSPPKVLDGKLAGETDYVWLRVGNLWTLNKPGEIVLAHERAENYGSKGTLVLFADGRVTFMDPLSHATAMARSAELLGNGPAEDF